MRLFFHVFLKYISGLDGLRLLNSWMTQNKRENLWEVMRKTTAGLRDSIRLQLNWAPFCSCFYMEKWRHEMTEMTSSFESLPQTHKKFMKSPPAFQFCASQSSPCPNSNKSPCRLVYAYWSLALFLVACFLPKAACLHWSMEVLPVVPAQAALLGSGWINIKMQLTWSWT